MEVDIVGGDADDSRRGDEIFHAPDEENVDPQMGLEVSCSHINTNSLQLPVSQYL